MASHDGSEEPDPFRGALEHADLPVVPHQRAPLDDLEDPGLAAPPG
jgi:hypothetical protein